MANYNGPVPMATYTISDGNGGTDSANLSFADVAPVNDPPVAVDDGPGPGDRGHPGHRQRAAATTATWTATR